VWFYVSDTLVEGGTSLEAIVTRHNLKVSAMGFVFGKVMDDVQTSPAKVPLETAIHVSPPCHPCLDVSCEVSDVSCKESRVSVKESDVSYKV